MAAEKGNKYAVGNKGGGRDPFYKSPDELQKKIDDYFTIEKVPTIPGLAYHLGFASKQSLIDNEAKQVFSFPIKRAKLRIEAFNAKELHRKEGSVTGIIFTLKNLGWKDQQDVDLNIDLDDFSEAALTILANNIIDKTRKNENNKG